MAAGLGRTSLSATARATQRYDSAVICFMLLGGTQQPALQRDHHDARPVTGEGAGADRVQERGGDGPLTATQAGSPMHDHLAISIILRAAALSHRPDRFSGGCRRSAAEPRQAVSGEQ